MSDVATEARSPAVRRGGKSSEEWTDERIARLRELHAEGYSYGAIADMIGGSITKNAVVGKARRLGLQLRESPIKAPKGDKRDRAEKARIAAKPDRNAPARPAAPGKATNASTVIAPRTFPAGTVAARGRACLWPIDEPGSSLYRECGEPVFVPAGQAPKPYCLAHCKRAFPAYRDRQDEAA